jgi:hypothetical protein
MTSDKYWGETGISIRYSTIERKETARIGYKGFLFLRWVPRCESPRPSRDNECEQINPLSNTGSFFYFNSNVFSFYNNSIVEKQMLWHLIKLKI